LSGAKENFKEYSILHIRNVDNFLCQETKDDFNNVTQIVCAFSKKPEKEFKKIQNDFFKIDTQIKKETFFLLITPYSKMKLYPMEFNLSVDDEVYQANVKLSKHWMAVGYKDEIPYIQNDKRSDTAINFPFSLAKDKLPYVGGLDIKGNPVHIKRVGDVTDYLQLKKYFAEEKYELCLETIENVLKDYPNSLFKVELLFYKIKVFAKLQSYDDLITAAKEYLQDYSSSENIAEVLSLIAKSYEKAGMSIDADYFFDRLFSEHEDSPYAKWGYIYKGEALEASGASSKAIEYYKKALYEAANIDIAATAAFRLAKFYILDAQPAEAAVYAMKIVNAKPSFFFKDDLKSGLQLMDSFAEESDYVTASAIAQVILDEMDKKYDEYESIVKDRGLWLSKTENKQEALIALNRYLDEYQYGSYEAEVQEAKDALFFDAADANLSTKLAQYDDLIEKYNGDSIGNKATYKKGKLLLENKLFSDVLGMEESLLALDNQTYPDVKEMIHASAEGVMKNALEIQECQEVINISNDYNITLSSKWDDGLYGCFMKGADYTLAKNIAVGNLKSKDLDERKKWLYRYIKVAFATGNYSDVIEASKELVSLIEKDKDSEYKDVYRTLFDTYQRVEQSNKMLEAIVSIEKVYGITYKDIDRYVTVMTIGSDKKDDTLVLKYGEEIMQIQNSSNSYAQTPFVEFTLYESYINKENFNAALAIMKSLDERTLTPNQRARQKYLLGSSYNRLWRDEEAKEAYNQAIKAEPASAWAKLAQDAKDI